MSQTFIAWIDVMPKAQTRKFNMQALEMPGIKPPQP
jgi:hypothetical protein